MANLCVDVYGVIIKYCDIETAATLGLTNPYIYGFACGILNKNNALVKYIQKGGYIDPDILDEYDIAERYYETCMISAATANHEDLVKYFDNKLYGSRYIYDDAVYMTIGVMAARYDNPKMMRVFTSKRHDHCYNIGELIKIAIDYDNDGDVIPIIGESGYGFEEDYEYYDLLEKATNPKMRKRMIKYLEP